MAEEFSPIPAVKTSTSIPPMRRKKEHFHHSEKVSELISFARWF
jgi:hypothetical protein